MIGLSNPSLLLTQDPASFDMGCSSSRVADLTELAPVRPVRPVHSARPARHNQHVDLELSAEVLTAALQYMAQQIAKRNGDITIVSVGGAVNVILLRTRRTTTDVDFFNQYLTRTEAHLLQDAAAKARQLMSSGQGVDLPDDWFNNRTMYFIPPHLRQQLTDEAIAQDEVIFHARGLRVLAAPWVYAFCAKVDCISGTLCARDTADAVNYLCCYLVRNRMSAVSVHSIRQWGSRYGTRTRDIQLRSVDNTYAGLFGARAIYW